MFIGVTVLFGVVLLPYAFFFGIAAYFFVAPCYAEMSGYAFIELFQKIDPYMKVWAKRLLLTQVASTLVLLGLLYAYGEPLPFVLSLLALGTALVSLIIAVKGNVPINREMDHWLPDAPPKDWEQVRDRCLRYHYLRGKAEIIGFLSLLCASLLYTARIG